MITLSASPDELTDEGRAWLDRDRIASAFAYACHQSEREVNIRRTGADAAFRYLTTRHKRKTARIETKGNHRHGIGWYLAYPFALLCGWIPLVPEAPHENEYESNTSIS